MRFVILSLVLSVCAGNVWSSSEQFDTIQSVQMYEVVTTADGSEEQILVENSGTSNVFNALAKSQGVVKSDINGVLMMTRQLIALGKEVYKVVEAGRPVVNVKSEPVQVLPLDTNGEAIAAVQLSGWKAPKAKKYRIETKNYLGMSPVIFEFMVIFSYGGSENGAGAYLTGAEIKPTVVDVKWGYDFNAEFKLQTIVNEGSVDSPIAGAVLMMDSRVKTPLQDRQLSKTFYINGLGDLNAY